jgi:hypothetical protein
MTRTPITSAAVKSPELVICGRNRSLPRGDSEAIG